MSKKRENSVDYLIDKGGELLPDIAGNMAAAIAGMALLGPPGIILGTIAGPVVKSGWTMIADHFCNGNYSDREEVRMGATLGMAINNIAIGIDEGKSIRQDDFYLSTGNMRSSGESILEGILLNSRNEYEEKKIQFYSSLLSNLNFDSSYNYEFGDSCLRILSDLSYRKLLILSYLQNNERLDTSQWTVKFANDERLGVYLDFFSELMQLYELKLLVDPNDGVSMSVRALSLSQFGITFCQLIDLQSNSFIEDENNLVWRVIEEIQNLIE